MEHELSRVVDALPGLIWTALPDGSVDYVNRRWCDYTGLSLEEARSQWQAAIHPEDLPGLLDCWQAALASGEALEIEVRLRRFDGEYRLFLFRGSALADTSGKIVKWCGMNTDVEDRTRSEKELHSRWWLWPPAREHHFRSVVDNLRALAVHITPAGGLEHVNRQALEYFGATFEEMKDWKIADVVHPEDLPRLVAAWQKGLQTGHSYDLEGRLRRADGAYRWFHVRSFPLRDLNERIVLWYFLLPDVDDRKQAEALLAGEKRLLEMMAVGEPLPVVLTALCRFFEEITSDCTCSVQLLDDSGTCLQQGASPSLPEKFTESVDGRPVSVDNGPCAMAAYLNEQVISADIASETRWGANRWCELALSFGLRACWSTPILSRTGKVLGTFGLYYAEPASPTPLHQGLIEQFTHLASIAIERAKIDTALKRSKAFLTEVQRLTATGGFSWNLSTDELTWSDEVFRIFEVDPALNPSLELTLSRLHPEDFPAFHEMRARQMASASDFEFGYRLLMPDQSVKYLTIVCHATRNEEGQPVYDSAVQDVTQRRLAEEALSKARSDLAHVARVTTLGALTASIAHEVNQPLSGIITNASTCLRMLAADPPNVDGARETARRTIRDGNRASDVISRLRALFSKQDATTEPVDVNEATREVIALSLTELQRGRVVVRPELADDLPPVTGDRIQLQQVILNLLLNASDAMSEVNDRPRQLVIRTERDEGDRVRLTVQDTGVGFAPHGADKLFDAFYTTKSHGMGIGLSVSRSIIESHNGRLWAVPNDGPGATFSFSIPRSPGWPAAVVVSA